MAARVTTSGDGKAGDGKATVPGIGPPRLVGRQAELGRLTTALARHPAVILVEGEAGIGKTRLVQEFLASPSGLARKALVTVCPPFGRPLTLGAVVDALRQAVGEVAGLGLSALAGALRPLFPEWAATLPPAPEPLEDAAAARHRLFGALAELLDQLGVTVLAVEDVQWADEATLEFLLFLACRQPRQVSLMITCRPEDMPAHSLLPRLSRLATGTGGCRLALRPLDMPETAAVMSSMLDEEPVSEEFAAFVHQHTEGVPLAVEESVRLMGERAYLARRSGRWLRLDVGEIEVPPTVRDLVLERAGRLGGDARAVLEAAAVLAAPASEQVLAAVAGLPVPRARDALGEALASRLLAEDDLGGRGLVSFRHALASRAVYEAIPGPRRRELHHRAGCVLESVPSPPAGRLALHFRAAGETSKWCWYGEQTADTALAAGDEAVAEALLYDLVTCGELPARDVARLVDKLPLGALVTDRGRHQALVAALRAALSENSLGPAEEAEARFQLGRLLSLMYDWNGAHVELARAVPGLACRPLMAATAMTMLGWPSGSDVRAEEHAGWVRRAAATAARLPEAGQLPMLVTRATILLLLGEEEGWAEAARIPWDPPTVQVRRQIARGHMNIGQSALIWGRYADARRHLDAGLELARVHGYRAYQSQARVAHAHLDWLAGAWDGLPGRVTALAAGEDITSQDRMEAVLVTGLLHAARGEYDQAREHLEQVVRQLGDGGAVVYSMEPSGALARLSLAEDRTDDALRVTDEPVRVIAAKGIWIWATDIAPVRVRALLAADRHPEAVDLVAAFARGLDGRDVPGPAAALTVCQAILAESDGEPDLAASLFAAAAARWQALPCPYEALLAREAQARCLLAAGQPDTALPMLSSLRQELIGLGALGDADRVVLALREQGVAAKRAQRGGRQSYGDRLSPREAEVVRLLARGQTDREVAASLFVSPKTVAYHVESARRKLKASSRAALVATALSLGIAPE